MPSERKASEILKDYLEENDLSYEALGEKLSWTNPVSRQVIYNWVNDKHPPSRGVLRTMYLTCENDVLALVVNMIQVSGLFAPGDLGRLKAQRKKLNERGDFF